MALKVSHHCRGGVATELALHELPARIAHTGTLQETALERIKMKVSHIRLNGPERALPNITARSLSRRGPDAPAGY
jgi:hypothetical protein